VLKYLCRKVLASLLNVEERVDWKSCLSSEEDDKADVRAFKTAFAPLTLSLDVVILPVDRSALLAVGA